MKNRFVPWLWLTVSVTAAACGLSPGIDMPGDYDPTDGSDVGAGTGGSSASGGAATDLDLGGGGQGGEGGATEAP